MILVINNNGVDAPYAERYKLFNDKDENKALEFISKCGFDTQKSPLMSGLKVIPELVGFRGEYSGSGYDIFVMRLAVEE